MDALAFEYKVLPLFFNGLSFRKFGAEGLDASFEGLLGDGVADGGLCLDETLEVCLVFVFLCGLCVLDGGCVALSGFFELGALFPQLLLQALDGDRL